MIEKIRAYIDQEFSRAPNNQKVQELKEELISNLEDKYKEQLEMGKSETAAYHFVISGIGDLSELVDSVRPQQPAMPLPTHQERVRRAVFLSVAVALYILSPFMVILFSDGEQGSAGVIVMFLFIAVATGLLIFNHMTRPIYKKTGDTVVEDFKQWRFESGGQSGNVKAYRSFRAAYWIIVAAVYFLVSFFLRIWAYSWVIFIIAVAVEQIVRGILLLKGEER
ncbi:MAG: hypothetical protein HFE39_10415 [Clostridiales bacterium]|jgi:hypothetical protein|nr:hypothetical protein [Clostridiales bacterium]